MIEPRPKRRRRGPKPVTAATLESAALHYLERYASSSANLRRVLMRRVARAAQIHDSDPAAGERLVDEIIARYLRAGLLDDRGYAANQAASLRRRGASRHAIRGRLAQKGVARDLVEDALGGDGEARSSEQAAACALVRRRRLGPCRPAADRARFRQKDLAVLARAGFELGLARRVLALPDAEAVAALERGEIDDG